MKANTKKPMRIFGHDVRTQYLIGVATHGPVTGRELARRLGIDPARLPSLFRVFQSCGVVSRDAKFRIKIDESFPAYSELTVLARALGGERVIVIPGDSSAKADWPRRSRLFGTSTRTRLLIALAVLESARVSDIAFAASMRSATVRHIVSAYEREGLLTTQHIDHERVVRFSDDFHFATLLKALLLRMAPSINGLERRASTVAKRVCESTWKANASVDRPVLPFGTDTQGRVLALIAEQPLRTRDIASVTLLSKHTVRQVLDVLESHDLIVTTVVGKGPRAARWVALNRSHPLSSQIKAFAAKSDTRQSIRCRVLPPKNLKDSRRVSGRRLPGERELKTSVMIKIHEIGEGEVPEIATALGRADYGRVRRCVEKLADARLIEYGLSGGRMRARMPRAASNAAELDALIAATRKFLD